MTEPENGWSRIRAGRSLHHCGASVFKRGGMWVPQFVDGTRKRTVFQTAQLARRFIKNSDPQFWGFDQPSSWSAAPLGGVMVDTGIVNDMPAFTIRTCDRFILRPFLERIFRKHVFERTLCAKCSEPMDSLMFVSKIYFGDAVHRYPYYPDSKFRSYLHAQAARGRINSGEGWFFAVCACGSPVWHHDHNGLCVKLREAQNGWDRQQRVRRAPGRYTQRDIQEIYRRQKGLCRYCEQPFAGLHDVTIDHVIPLISGGTHWPRNLSLACQNCNSRKGGMALDEFLAL